MPSQSEKQRQLMAAADKDKPGYFMGGAFRNLMRRSTQRRTPARPFRTSPQVSMRPPRETPARRTATNSGAVANVVNRAHGRTGFLGRAFSPEQLQRIAQPQAPSQPRYTDPRDQRRQRLMQQSRQEGRGVFSQLQRQLAQQQLDQMGPTRAFQPTQQPYQFRPSYPTPGRERSTPPMTARRNQRIPHSFSRTQFPPGLQQWINKRREMAQVTPPGMQAMQRGRPPMTGVSTPQNSYANSMQQQMPRWGMGY